MYNFDLLDLLTLLSFFVGVQNLSLNEEQVNNLQRHLNEQDSILQEQQNKMLDKIIAMLNEILEILKERK